MANPAAALDRQDRAVASIDMLDVRVIGPTIEDGAISLQRYALELTAALQQFDEVDVRRELGSAKTIYPRPPRAKPRPPALRALGRFRARARGLRPRLQAHLLRGDLFHLIDQRDSQLIGALRPDRTVQTIHDLLGVAEARSQSEADRFRGQLARAGRIVAVSQATRAEVIEQLDYPTERISVIPNGLNGQFRVIPPARLRLVHDLLPEARYRVLHVASNDQPRKNIRATVRVIRTLRQQGLDAILVRAGVPLPDAEQQLANELGVADHIVDLGIISEDRLVELYNAANVFLFSSIYEGFGWPPVEAMACGLPVVASMAAALPEVLGPSADRSGSGGAALLAPPHDIEALASHVAAVLTDDTLASRLRAAGRAHAEQYSWERAATSYLEVYRSLLDD